MQKITTYLTFAERGEEAVKFYVSLFQNGQINNIVRYEEGGPFPAGSLLNASFELDGQQFMAMDARPALPLCGRNIADGGLQEPGRGGQVLRWPGGGRREAAVRLGKGQVWRVLADRSQRIGRADGRSRIGPRGSA